MSTHQRHQLELPLPAQPAGDDEPLVPARMLNEWVYCPRLAYLEWVEGSWEDNADTAQGKRAHIRADKPGPAPPPPDDFAEGAPDFRTRSVTPSSQRLGLVARIDVLVGEDGLVTPIDYKKGKRPHVEKGPTTQSASRSAPRGSSSRTTATGPRRARSGSPRAASACVSRSIPSSVS